MTFAVKRGRRQDEVKPRAVDERIIVESRERNQECQAKPHPTRGDEGEDDAQGNPEQKNKQHIDFELALSALQKPLIQDIVDHVGMNFDARIISASVRCYFQVANSCSRGADKNKLVLKSVGTTLSWTTSAIE